MRKYLRLFLCLALALTLSWCFATAVQATETGKVAISSGGTHDTLEDALTAAADGDVITLLDDMQIDALEFSSNAILDLNGHTLTTFGVMNSGEAIIDSTNGQGTLKVPKSAFALSNQENNGYMPIWNGTDGFTFAAADAFDIQIMTVGPKGGEAELYFVAKSSAGINACLAPGSETSGVDLKVAIRYTIHGEEKEIFGTYTDELVRKFYAGYNADSGVYGKAFKLALSGTKGVTALSYEVYFEAYDVKISLGECAAEVVWTYEEYMDMSAADQKAYRNSFASVSDFFAWYNAAKAEYDANKPGVDIGDDAIDLGGGNGNG